jgi:hypothetical protein
VLKFGIPWGIRTPVFRHHLERVRTVAGRQHGILVDRVGFEPTRLLGSDLQSDSFGHSLTYPLHNIYYLNLVGQVGFEPTQA